MYIAGASNIYTTRNKRCLSVSRNEKKVEIETKMPWSCRKQKQESLRIYCPLSLAKGYVDLTAEHIYDQIIRISSIILKVI